MTNLEQNCRQVKKKLEKKEQAALSGIDYVTNSTSLINSYKKID